MTNFPTNVNVQRHGCHTIGHLKVRNGEVSIEVLEVLIKALQNLPRHVAVVKTALSTINQLLPLVNTSNTSFVTLLLERKCNVLVMLFNVMVDVIDLHSSNDAIIYLCSCIRRRETP